MPHIRCAIGLGGNLGDIPGTLVRAVQGLDQLQDTRIVGVSGLYRSKPIGPADQPDYANAVVLLDTLLSPWQLLDALQALETDAARVRALRWGARTLDLDLLLYGDSVIHDTRLTVPHPEMQHRAFVLRPLQEVWPDAHWSGMHDIVTLLQHPALIQQALEPWLEPRWLAIQSKPGSLLRSTT